MSRCKYLVFGKNLSVNTETFEKKLRGGKDSLLTTGAGGQASAETFCKKFLAFRFPDSVRVVVLPFTSCF